MHGLDAEWARIAVGWGLVASVLVWLLMRLAYREALDDRDHEDEV